MELYIARQPVFDRNKNIVGYELLHRESQRKNEYAESDGGYASSRVITGAFLTLGLDSLTSGKLAFINFTGELLMNGVASLLPRDQLVIEILENVTPTQEIINACLQLKDQGYTLALDDYVLDPVFAPLTTIADIIKVDFRQVSESDQKIAIHMHERPGLTFLAEKVETEEEFQRAAALGYTLFQGYFFSKPVIMSASTIPANKLGYVKLMQAVNHTNPDFRSIASAIETDVTLSLETIKLSNSAFYGRRQRISSIRQAVVTLGLAGVRKWIYLSSLRRLGTGKPDILISTSIIRSKFMENLSETLGLVSQSSQFSMLGLFSMLDAIMNCSFDTVLSDLYILDEMKVILTGGPSESILGKVYSTMLSYERGDWDGTAETAVNLGLTLDKVAEAYITAIKWYNDFSNIATA